MNKLYLIETRSGHKTAVVRGFRLHSAYDPVKEAQRATDSFDPGRSSIILVSGAGLGFHVSALKNRFPQHIIAVSEADSNLLKTALELYPEYFSGCSLITSPQNAAEFIESIDLKHFKGISHYSHRPSFQLDPDFYREIIETAKNSSSSKISDMLTRFEFEERWVSNIFRNIPYLLTSSRISQLFGAFKGIPGIIVSAGPSLRKNVHQLKKLRDRALILCVDTALPVLKKCGVEPHIVMTLDAQKHSHRHFSGIDTSGINLLADMVSCTPVIRDFTGGIIISTTSKYYTDTAGATHRETTPAIDWVENFAGPIGDIQSGGSVATSAFDALLNMGCSSIILVGQDLAYTGREIHSSGTYHNDGWLPACTRLNNLDTINQQVIRKRKIFRTDSVGNSGTVITDFVLNLYKGWFEDSSAKTGIDVINSTEGGARIRNTIEKPLAEIAGQLPKPLNKPEDIIRMKLQIKAEGCVDSAKIAVSASIRSLEKLNIIADSSNYFSELKEKTDSFAKQSGIAPLLGPYLRKADMHISRREIPDAEAFKMLKNEILRATGILRRLLTDCSKTLNKI